jgi:hypothetical protein
MYINSKKEKIGSPEAEENVFFWFLLILVFVNCSKTNKMFLVPLLFACGTVYYVYQM